MPRATRTHGPGTRRSGRHSRSLGGRRAAISRSTLAGQHLTTRSRCDASRRNLSRHSPMSFFRAPHPPRPHCFNKRARSPSFLRSLPTQSAAAVASFARPGGNVTGFIFTEPTMAGKWLELLKQIAPRIARVAMLFNPVSAPYADYWLNPFNAAATSFAVEAIPAPVRDRSELETVIAAQAREPNGGLIAMPDSFLEVNRVEITSLAARYRLPAVYPFRLFAEVGGLLSYGVDRTDNFRRAATYVDRIFKGENSAELPVQAPIKFELVVNLKTAKAIGLDVPLHLQQLADEIIE